MFRTLKDGSLQNNKFVPETIVSVSETSSKMVVKKVNNFLLKSSTFLKFEPYDFVQISPICGPNTYHIMYGDTLDFWCQHHQW